MTPRFKKALIVPTSLLALVVAVFIYSATAVTPSSPPTAPSGLTATAASCSCINLSWMDNSSTESGFKIERCQGSGCTNFAQIAIVGINITSYSDTGLAAMTTYTYRVRAYNTAGNSAYTNTASATTQGPNPCPTPTPGGPSAGG